MAGYDPLRRWNVYMYAGPTFLFGDGGADFAANIGGMVTYNLSRNLSLFYSHTVYRMPKNRYPHHMVYTRDGIFTNNLNIGVMYSFDAFHDLIARGNNDEPTRRPLFLEYSFGPTFMSKTPISGFKTTGFDSKFLVGWWANSAIGVRSCAHVTNANWNDGHYNNKPVTYLIGTRGALFDLLVNPLGFSSQYNWDSRFGFNLFGGFELGHAKKTNKGFVNTFEGNYHSFRLGGQLWTKLTNDLRVTLEPTFTALKLSTADDNRHNQFSLNVGVAMMMISQKKSVIIYRCKVSLQAVAWVGIQPSGDGNFLIRRATFSRMRWYLRVITSQLSTLSVCRANTWQKRCSSQMMLIYTENTSTMFLSRLIIS